MATSITTSARSLSTLCKSFSMVRMFSGVSRTVIELVVAFSMNCGWRPAFAGSAPVRSVRASLGLML